jgi:hypothetical protein
MKALMTFIALTLGCAANVVPEPVEPKPAVMWVCACGGNCTFNRGPGENTRCSSRPESEVAEEMEWRCAFADERIKCTCETEGVLCLE